MTDVAAHSVPMLLNTVRTLEPLIRAHANEAEQSRHLPQPVVTALAEAGMFRMYTPRTLGGGREPNFPVGMCKESLR